MDIVLTIDPSIKDLFITNPRRLKSDFPIMSSFLNGEKFIGKFSEHKFLYIYAVILVWGFIFIVF